MINCGSTLYFCGLNPIWQAGVSRKTLTSDLRPQKTSDLACEQAHLFGWGAAIGSWREEGGLYTHFSSLRRFSVPKQVSLVAGYPRPLKFFENDLSNSSRFLSPEMFYGHAMFIDNSQLERGQIFIFSS